MSKKRPISESLMESYEFLLESKFQKYVLKRLSEVEGGKFFKVSERYVAGIPDIIGCYNGQFIALELKVGKNKPSANQAMVLGQVHKAGGVSGVVRNWGEVKEILRLAGLQFD